MPISIVVEKLIDEGWTLEADAPEEVFDSEYNLCRNGNVVLYWDGRDDRSKIERKIFKLLGIRRHPKKEEILDTLWERVGKSL
ncbi:hypothetical protein COV24_01225 [candidate division WWE3 bacterium CG10_big_fil_rev_8_21_14_0_10_32_10]|uniref:Uncharacterized protein n=1 Tax=candidate division WWE3 bacterium CG10_big_fil_rev_8_21_14_0_10_32_10 TaxID=1975090 RepID=A0A2H0RB18_UNCKA|nr:MAG: hypothetical protein COV24_01225 [candidate division WWE3 bacterium CG10_big_fil_rev_8_21_14_0_10_32_10]